MESRIKILILEEKRQNTTLAINEFQKSKLHQINKVVRTRKAFIKALREFKPSVILSSYYLQEFNGLDALMFVQKFQSGIPFIFLTDPINELTAVKCIKAGAHDYISINNLNLLVGSIKEAVNKDESSITERQNQKFIESIINSFPDIIYIYDLEESKNVYVNKGIQLNLGYSGEEIRRMGSKLIKCLMHPDDFKEYVNNTFPRYYALSDNDVLKHEYRMKHKDGNWRWLQSRESIFARHADGIPKQIFGIIENISEIRFAGEALIKSEERFKRALENIPDIIVIYDKSLRIQYINDTARSITERSGTDFIGKKNEEILPPEVYKNYLPTLKKVLTTRKTQTIETKLPSRNGSISYFHITCVPVINSQGELYEILTISHNYTEQKKAEIEIDRINRVYNLISQINQMIVRSRNKSKILSESCKIAVKYGKFRMAWVGLLDEDQQFVKPVAQSGYNNGYLEKIKGKISNNKTVKQNSITKSILSGHYYCSNNISDDPAMIHLRKDALERKYLSSIALPIIINKKVKGAFHLYSSEENFFNKEEIKLLEEVTSDIAYSLNAIDIEEKKKEAEKKSLKYDRIRRETEKIAKMGGWEFDIKTFEGTWTDEVARIHDLDPINETNANIGLNFYKGEHRKKIENAIDLAIKKGKSYNLELELVSAKGIKKWVRTIGKPVKSGGKIVKLKGSFQDITHQKEAENEIKRTNRIYAVISQINQMIVRTREKEKILAEACKIVVDQGQIKMAWIGLVDEKNERIVPAAWYGLEDKYLIKIKDSLSYRNKRTNDFLSKIIHQGKYVFCNDILNEGTKNQWNAEALKRGYSSSITFPIIVKGKPAGIFDFYSSEPFFFDNHEIRLLEEVTNDIAYAIEMIENRAKRKSAEESLRKLSRVVEQSPASVVITNTKGEIEYVNPAFSKLTGYSQTELFEKSSRVLQSDFIKSELYKILWKTIKAGNVWHGELMDKKKNDDSFWIEVSISPVKNEEGAITHYVAIGEDITSRKKTLEELIVEKDKAEQSDKLKGEFLAQMSHEIRTPLNSMINYTGLLKDDLCADRVEEYSHIFNGITNSGLRIIRTIDLILNSSAIQANAYDYKKTRLDIYDKIVLPVYNELKRLAEIKKIDFRIVRLTRNTYAEVDEYSIAQSLINLIDNAIKYTSNGFVEIRILRNKQRLLQIDVEDTGIGIRKQFMNHLFNPFTQEESGYSRRFEGTGLGLSLVKNYCSMNNANITVKSRKNVGTTFSIVLNQ